MLLINQCKDQHNNVTSRLSPLSIYSYTTYLLLSEKEGANVICGYTQCSKCKCQAYEGSGQVCGNCGHSYNAHY